MKKVLPFFLSLLFIAPVFGQLDERYNSIRIGDKIVKQQVEYKEPGEAGYPQFWDFSDLKVLNDAYELVYSPAPLLEDSIYVMGYSTFPKGSVGEEELIVGTEHNTMYYYRLKNRVLQLLGHENPTIKLLYNTPLIPMKFPLNYGEPATHSEYSSDGLYSSRIDLHNEGTYSIVADAFGEMVLPTGDTISPVLRVKTEQVIGDDLYHPTNKVETYSWYTEGYRYPLFETVRNISMIDDQEIFSTSFFYPPQEHLYIDDDPENLAILEEKWRLEDEQNADENTPDVQVKTATLDDIMECRMFPNPVELVLNIEYTLKKNANVSFYIYSMEGNIVKMIKNKFQKAGTYYEYINCYSLQRRNYVLRITADDKFTNEVIIKK